MIDFSLGVAFTAGIISFLAPCILPIIPGFLSYLAGAGKDTEVKRIEVFLNSVFFVLGFSLVFSAFGVLLNTILEAVAYDVQIWLSRVGGAIIIFFGVYLLGFMHISFFEREYRLTPKTKFQSRYFTSLLFGSAFAAGWTPCVGAVLGAILGLAASQPGRAFWLLFSYSVGLGVPFLLVGLFAAQASVLIRKFGRYVKYINMIFGTILIIIGILVFTQNLAKIANFELLNRILLR